jgi:hypothetical protein
VVWAMRGSGWAIQPNAKRPPSLVKRTGMTPFLPVSSPSCSRPLAPARTKALPRNWRLRLVWGERSTLTLPARARSR